MKLTKFNDLKRVGYALGPSTIILGTGLVLHGQSYGEPIAWGLGAAALGSAYIALNKGWNAAWVFAGGFAYASAVTLLGVSWDMLLAWAAASAGALGLRLWFEHHTRNHDLDRKIKLKNYEAAVVRQKMALHRLENTLGAPAAPVLTGHTPEETAIRETFYTVYKRELPGIAMEHSEGGWRAVITTPADLPRDKVLREWPLKIQNGLGLGGRYVLENGGLDNQLVVKYSDVDLLADLIPYAPAEHEHVGDPIYLGPDEDGGDTLIRLLERHTLILGTSGNGKSNLVNTFILALVRAGAAVIGIDMKKGIELAPVKDLLVTLATNAQDARTVLDWMETETDRRAELMIAAGLRSWSEELGPFVWIVTDELAELTQKKHNEEGLEKLSDMLDSGTRINRAFGIHFISATQAPSKNVFGGSTDGRANYKVRISTRLEEEAHAQFGFGPSWKSKGWDPNAKLHGPGEFLLSSEDQEHRKPIRRKAPYVSNEDLKAEVARLLPYKVGLENSPWGEGGVQLSPSQLVRKFLRRSGEVTRAEIEAGTGLDKKQVLAALAKLGPEIEKEAATGTRAGVYWLAPDGPVERLLGQGVSR